MKEYAPMERLLDVRTAIKSKSGLANTRPTFAPCVPKINHIIGDFGMVCMILQGYGFWICRCTGVDIFNALGFINGKKEKGVAQKSTLFRVAKESLLPMAITTTLD